ILEPLLAQRVESVTIANRTAAKAVDLADEFSNRYANIRGCGFDSLSGSSFDLILNATAASLSNELPPLPTGLLAQRGVCYDLAYADTETTFVQWGLQNHARLSLDGLGMLVEQAAEAFFIWRGVRPETAPVIEMLNAERHRPQI
ncbi:MAG: shikimate dehydrogenase, partial [Gammaproteobacteria bacterium]